MCGHLRTRMLPSPAPPSFSGQYWRTARRRPKWSSPNHRGVDAGLPGLVPRIISNAVAVAGIGLRYTACPTNIAVSADIAAIGSTRRCAPHLPGLACRTDIGGGDSSGCADPSRICGRRCSNCRLGCANGNNHQTRKAAGADDGWEREFLRRHGIVLFVARPPGLAVQATRQTLGRTCRLQPRRS